MNGDLFFLNDLDFIHGVNGIAPNCCMLLGVIIILIKEEVVQFCATSSFSLGYSETSVASQLINRQIRRVVESPFQRRNKMNETLKSKEKLFGFYYQKLRNGREAAVKAGYLPMFAEKTAAKLLQNSSILQYIDGLDHKCSQENLHAQVVSGLKRLAFGSIADSLRLLITNEQEALEKLETIDLFQISEIKKTRENAMELKFFDRFKALEKLMELSSAEKDKEGVGQFFRALEDSARMLGKQNSDD